MALSWLALLVAGVMILALAYNVRRYRNRRAAHWVDEPPYYKDWGRGRRRR